MKPLLAIALFGAALLATPAHATLSMMVASTVITDNGANDQDNRLGVISYTGSVGNFNMNLSTQTGTFATSPIFFDLADTLVASEAGSLTIKLTSTGLTSPAAASMFLTQFSGNFANGSATVTANTYFDASNTAFGTAELLASLTASSSPFNLSASAASGGGAPFSLTEVVTINAAGATSFSLDTTVSAVPVPEPASLLLLGASLITAGVLRLRRNGRCEVGSRG